MRKLLNQRDWTVITDQPCVRHTTIAWSPDRAEHTGIRFISTFFFMCLYVNHVYVLGLLLHFRHQIVSSLRPRFTHIHAHTHARHARTQPDTHKHSHTHTRRTSENTCCAAPRHVVYGGLTGCHNFNTAVLLLTLSIGPEEVCVVSVLYPSWRMQLDK